VKVKAKMVSCLLIDENATESARIAGLLASLHITTTELKDVELGIRHCHENRPDVVLLEATALPKAHEFLRLVRYQSRQTGRPVVILYASRADMGQMGESILHGASEFLLGPFDMDLLEFKLRQSGVLVAAAA
jgi:two-component system, chemotaxis family, chemotaxis protein CheY